MLMQVDRSGIINISTGDGANNIAEVVSPKALHSMQQAGEQIAKEKVRVLNEG